MPILSQRIRRRQDKRRWLRRWRQPDETFRCYWCAAKLVPDEMTVDHIVPRHYFLKRGRIVGVPTGQFTLNTVPACQPCNNSRGRFMALLAKLHRIPYVSRIPKVPRDRMLALEARLIGMLGSEFVEWRW